MFTAGNLDSGLIDSGNSPTFDVRPGLVLGQKIATGTWTNYSAGNSDGSEIAGGIMVFGVRMADLSSVPQPRFIGIIVGGRVQSARLLGLDQQARQQLRNFIFDDAFNGNTWFPWKREITKTANYTALSTDNFTLFDNNGAAGAVTITLPPILNGYYFGIKAIANQNFAITSNEGTNVVADNNASASTLTISTGGHIIGGGVVVFTNPGATKWISVYYGSGIANTITVT